MPVSSLVNPTAVNGAAQHIVVPFVATKSPNTTTRIVFPAGYVKSYQFQVQSIGAAGLGFNGSSPLLDAKLQTSYDSGATWSDIGSGAAVQITTANHVDAAISSTAAHGDLIGILLTVGGTATASIITIAPSGANNDIDFATTLTDGTKDSCISVAYILANDTAIGGYTFPKASASLTSVTTGAGTPANPYVCVVSLGTGAGTKASLTTSLTGLNNDLVFTAKKSGIWANGATGGVTVAYLAQTAASAPLSVSVSGGDISVKLGMTAGTKDGYSTNLSNATNNDLDWSAPVASGGGVYTITYLDPGKTSMPLSVYRGTDSSNKPNNDIIVSLATNSAGTITTIASDITKAVLGSNHVGTVLGITAVNHSGNDGSGLVAALAKQSFTGFVAPAISSTSAQITTAIQALTAANALVDITNSGGDTGAGVVTALTKSNLASGVDPVGTSTAAQVITQVGTSDVVSSTILSPVNHSPDTGAGAITTAMPGGLVTNGAVSIAGQLDVALGYV